MRISGLLVVGAVAVAAAAFTSDGAGTTDGRGGGSTIVTAGPSEGTRRLPTGPPERSAPVARQSPDGQASALLPTVTPGGVPSGAVSEPPSAAPAPSPSRSDPVVLQAPPWLPPGPGSPDSDGTPDPASVYDLLRAPSQCRSALEKIPQRPADEEWQLLRGLAGACLAVQGRGGGWETAAGVHAALAGRVDTCKGRAAYTVLGGLLDFHRRHPSGTVRLTATTDGAPACGYRIAGVDTGGDAEARPGDTVGIELADTYFDHAELLRDASVSIGGQQVPGVPVLKSESGDRLVLSVVIPALEPGPADVTVRHAGVESRMPAAFTVSAPDVVQEPDPGASPNAPDSTPLAGEPLSWTPHRMLPLGPLPAHRAGSHTPPGLGIPQRHADMAGEDDPDGEGQPVVDEGGTRTPHQGGEMREPHHQTGAEHHQRRPGDPGGVDLLPGVELPRRTGGGPLVTAQGGAQPHAVVRAEAVEEAQVGAERAGGEAGQDGHGQGEAGPLVEADHQLAAADEFGELRDVQAGRRHHAHAHQRGRRTVHPALGPAEAPHAHGAGGCVKS
ncbi:hypothetical protein AQI70_27480 [Streptomyces curacoi]|uniref:Secreted protein n=1 Tax=Streptomyces curacoi TaxID=146536 RepID=A0A117P1J4_9ACTN|nr:hypothetical protein AQI70_27480 [Streptomyces curacoi]